MSDTTVDEKSTGRPLPKEKNDCDVKSHDKTARFSSGNFSALRKGWEGFEQKKERFAEGIKTLG
ncbi:MAG: hypothetical protein INR73_28125 [Williamsia sp.]|nr:hypothetical protein [Williamsia sp.]